VVFGSTGSNETPFFKKSLSRFSIFYGGPCIAEPLVIQMALCCKPSTDNTDVIGTETPEGDGKSKALGAQTISSWGSFVLNINNLVGPALVTFPLVYQSGTLKLSGIFDCSPFGKIQSL
jgi:hypothetical protein